MSLLVLVAEILACVNEQLVFRLSSDAEDQTGLFRQKGSEPVVDLFQKPAIRSDRRLRWRSGRTTRSGR